MGTPCIKTMWVYLIKIGNYSLELNPSYSGRSKEETKSYCCKEPGRRLKYSPGRQNQKRNLWRVYGHHKCHNFLPLALHGFTSLVKWKILIGTAMACSSSAIAPCARSFHSYLTLKSVNDGNNKWLKGSRDARVKKIRNNQFPRFISKIRADTYPRCSHLP